MKLPRTSSNARLSALAIIAALALCLPVGFAQAQIEPETIGQIKGTNMTRDEFRGRAMAQLSAIALNAVTYYLIHNEYPAEFYRLRGSESWNLDVQNMFSNRPVQGIMFEPQSGDFTSDPAIGLPGVEVPMSFSAPPPMDGNTGGGTGGGPGGDGGFGPITVISDAGSRRVDPKRVRDFQGGDVLFYTKDSLLQLVMFAPDGTYCEWVDEVPNVNFRNYLRLRGDDPSGQLLASAELLYYAQYVLPRYYNLAQFMSNLPTESSFNLDSAGASRRIEMAKSIGVTMRNPYTKQAIQVGSGSAGDFASDSAVLAINGPDGSPLALADLAYAPDESVPSVKGGTKGSGGRQPGGSKGGGKGGNGRQPGGRQPR